MKAMVYLIISIELLFAISYGNYCKRNIVYAQLNYFNNRIHLQIINNSEDSLYFPIKDFSSLNVLFNNKRIKDIYDSNANDLSIDDAKLKSLISKKYPKAHSWNHENPLLVDSILFDYFLGEFKEINKKIVIDSISEKDIISYITTVFQLEGGYLFLRSKEVYSIDFKCDSLNKIGKYEINFSKKKRRYHTKSVTLKNNQLSMKYLIPIIPPSNLLGFKRYDGQIVAKKVILNNSK